MLLALASRAEIISWAGNAATFLGFDIPYELPDKGKEVRVEGTTNFERFDQIDPALSELVLAHVALGYAQQGGQLLLGHPFVMPKFSQHRLEQPIRIVMERRWHAAMITGLT